MIAVGVSGAAGRMGRLVSEMVLAAEDLRLAALYAPGRRSIEIGGLSSSDDPGVMESVTVVVEVTNPDVVMENLRRWRGFGVHAVVGTSGFTAERLFELEGLWGKGPPNCLVVPNFSISAILMMRFAELAAPHLEGAEPSQLKELVDYPRCLTRGRRKGSKLDFGLTGHVILYYDYHANEPGSMGERMFDSGARQPANLCGR